MARPTIDDLREMMLDFAQHAYADGYEQGMQDERDGMHVVDYVDDPRPEADHG